MPDSPTDARALLKRLRPLYATAFLQGFVLWYAIEKIFMRHIGINNDGIALIVVLFTLVMMLANVPLGILADRWSRKGVLALASVALGAGTFLDGISQGFWLYLLGSCLWGIFYACYSGTYDSIVYDTLLEDVGSTNSFERYYGKVQLVDSIALVLGSLSSGLVVHFLNLQSAYFITLPFVALSLLTLWRFKEPRLHKSDTPSLLRAHIRDIARAILQRREIAWLVLSLIALTVAERIVLEFDQLWLIALALPLGFYGPVNALLLAALGGGGLMAHRVKAKSRVIGAVAVLMLAASACLLFRFIGLVILALFLLILAMFTIQINVNRWLHDSLPSKIRAGASSLVITIGYAIFLPAGILFGHISHVSSIFAAGWMVVVICLVILIATIAALRVRQTAK